MICCSVAAPALDLLRSRSPQLSISSAAPLRHAARVLPCHLDVIATGTRHLEGAAEYALSLLIRAEERVEVVHSVVRDGLLVVVHCSSRGGVEGTGYRGQGTGYRGHCSSRGGVEGSSSSRSGAKGDSGGRVVLGERPWAREVPGGYAGWAGLDVLGAPTRIVDG